MANRGAQLVVTRRFRQPIDDKPFRIEPGQLDLRAELQNAAKIARRLRLVQGAPPLLEPSARPFAANAGTESGLD